eukprot:1143870-Pyramimonas_sp.AAC.1
MAAVRAPVPSKLFLNCAGRFWKRPALPLELRLCRVLAVVGVHDEAHFGGPFRCASGGGC